MTVLVADPILQRRAEIHRIAQETDHRRELLSRIGVIACRLCLVIAIVPLLGVIAYVVVRGVSAWNWAFFSHLPTPAGIPGGGISNAIIGAAIIDGIAAAFAIPFGIAVGLFLALSEGRLAGVLRFSADVMSGVPSIIVGIFAYLLLVRTFGHFSALAASFAIGLLMLPIIMRAGETAIRSVPREFPEAAVALGARQTSTTWRVLLPAALPGLMTGGILAFARGAGETAPLLFTAIGSQYLVTNPNKPMASLPLVVFQNGIQAYPDIVKIAWGAALFLLVVVMLLSIGSRVVAARLRTVERA